ncbi:MAG: hypothetical protein LBI13_08535 [Streptococcaceae bacterium]|nr:hypothetical protein [Streptococcaceae bacterium]
MSIHTINARDFIAFLAFSDFFHWNSFKKFEVLNHEVEELRKLLKSKQISYDDLKTVLTPSLKKREIALFFDTFQIKETFYGGVIFNHVLPLLDKVKTHAIFSGDLIFPGIERKMDNEIFIKLIRNINVLHFPISEYASQYFAVYLNNIDENEINKIVEGLREHVWFLGFADVTQFCFVKELVAHSIGQTALKFKNKVIVPQMEDEIDANDLTMYPFSKYGFEVVGINEWYYGLFLEYKIETEIVDEVDLLLSLNALNENPIPLDQFKILVEPEKFEYITKNEKHNLNIIRKVGIDQMSIYDFESLMFEKLKVSYIFNLEVNQFIAKFNTKFELNNKYKSGVSNLIASFEYNFKDNILRLITMY